MDQELMDPDLVDEVYRGYRIAITWHGIWHARITTTRGPVTPLRAQSSFAEGARICSSRARALVDNYIAFLDNHTDRRQQMVRSPAPDPD